MRSSYGDWAPAALALVAAAVNGWVATKNCARMVSHSTDMHRQLARLLGEWEELWADVYTADEKSVRDRWRDLQRRT